MKEKPYVDISITKLVGRAMVGRSTFYRNFDDMVDILYWQCDRQFAQVLCGYVEYGQKDGFGLLEYVFGYWQKNSEILELLLSINRIDIIYDCFGKNSSIVMDDIQERLKLPYEQHDYFLSIRIGVFIGVMKTWLQNGKREKAHQLSSMVGEQLLYAANNGLIF